MSGAIPGSSPRAGSLARPRDGESPDTAAEDQLLELLLAISEANGERATALAIQMGEVRGELDQPRLLRDVQELLYDLSGRAAISIIGSDLPPKCNRRGARP